MEMYVFITDYDMEQNYYMIGIIMANVEMWWHDNMMYISIRNDKSKVIHLFLIYAWEMLPREISILIS